MGAELSARCVCVEERLANAWMSNRERPVHDTIIGTALGSSGGLNYQGRPNVSTSLSHVLETAGLKCAQFA